MDKPEFVSVSKAFENNGVRKEAGLTVLFVAAAGVMAYLGAYKAAAILTLPAYWQYLETCYAVNRHGSFTPKWAE